MTTIRVRIAVAINSAGQWNSCGWCNGRPVADDEKRDMAVDCLEEGGPEHVVWLEADVPVPGRQSEPTVAADVSAPEACQ